MARKGSDRRRRGTKGPTGIPVDASGGPTIDPTQNVLDLTRAAHRRQDDLRKLQAQLQDEKIKRVEQVAQIHAGYAKELRRAEASRVDANRQFDRAERERSSFDQLQATRTLEQTWRKTEDTLRSMVDSTAKTLALQTAEQVGAVNNRLLALERTSSKDEGKQALADPQMERLVALVGQLATAQTAGTGKSAGANMLWAYLIGGAGLVFGGIGAVGVAIGIIVAILKYAG